jgi:hypothetical protein
MLHCTRHATHVVHSSAQVHLQVQQQQQQSSKKAPAKMYMPRRASGPQQHAGSPADSLPEGAPAAASVSLPCCCVSMAATVHATTTFDKALPQCMHDQSADSKEELHIPCRISAAVAEPDRCTYCRLSQKWLLLTFGDALPLPCCLPGLLLLR